MTEKRTRGKFTYGYKLWITPDQQRRLEAEHALTERSKNWILRDALDQRWRKQRMQELNLTEDDLDG